MPQSSTNLSIWVTNGLNASLINDQWILSVPNSNPASFYRLQR